MRYIIDKKGVELLKLKTLPAVETLASDITITNEALLFENFSIASVELSNAQVDILKANNISCTKEVVGKGDKIGGVLLDYAYEKKRSGYNVIKAQNNYSAAGIKMADGNTGCNLSYFNGINVINNNTNVTDIFNHGTGCVAIMQGVVPATSYQVGLLNDAEIHVVKCISDVGGINETSLLAYYDYCINNSIDIVNCSFAGYINNPQPIMDALWNAGCIVFASTGNYAGAGDSNMVQPASLLNVFACNSMQENGDIMHKSVINYDNPTKGVAFAANGWQCEWITKNLNLGFERGTSLSAPFCAAAFAIILKRLRNIDPVRWTNQAAIKYCLEHAILKGDSKYFGKGYINLL